MMTIKPALALAALLLIGLCGLAFAATRGTDNTAVPQSKVALRSAIRTDTVSVPGMQCDQCEKRITGKLMSTNGVVAVVANADAKHVVVTYQSAKITLRKIEKAIALAGYDAGSTISPDKAKKWLPACCRVPQ